MIESVPTTPPPSLSLWRSYKGKRGKREGLQREERGMTEGRERDYRGKREGLQREDRGKTERRKREGREGRETKGANLNLILRRREAHIVGLDSHVNIRMMNMSQVTEKDVNPSLAAARALKIKAVS